MRSSLLTAIIICVIVGAAGGLVVAMVVPASSITGILLGAFYGLFFALLAAARVVSPGTGLLWGLGYAFILWVAIPAGIVPVLMGRMPSMECSMSLAPIFLNSWATSSASECPWDSRWEPGKGFSLIRGSQLSACRVPWWSADSRGWSAAG